MKTYDIYNTFNLFINNIDIIKKNYEEIIKKNEKDDKEDHFKNIDLSEYIIFPLVKYKLKEKGCFEEIPEEDIINESDSNAIVDEEYEIKIIKRAERI